MIDVVHGPILPSPARGRRVALAGVALAGVALAEARTGDGRNGGGPRASLGRGSIGGAWDLADDLAVAIGFLVVGLLVWVPAWFATLGARRRSPSQERTATVARAYLYLILGASLVTAVPTGAYVLYRLLDDALGAVSAGLVADIAVPLATAIVAAAIGAYHGWLIVGDLRMSAGDVERATTPPARTERQQGIAVHLVLHGAPELDVDGALTAVREAWPPGAWIETERSADGAPGPVTLVGSA